MSESCERGLPPGWVRDENGALRREVSVAKRLGLRPEEIEARVALSPLGSLIRGFKAGASKRWKEICSAENGRARNAAGGNEQPAENGRARNAAGGCVPANSFAGVPVWSEGFQDTVLLHRGQLDNMFNYLRDNPRRLAIKRLFPELFKVVGEIGVNLAPREPKPGGGQRIARDAAGRPLVDFASPLFEKKKAALFAAAKHGHALISPCVSDGEREIARLALEARLPLVTLQNKGFSPLQKPGGRSFDACADGRLLMLAPAAWPYLPGEKKMTRFDAVALNRLAQLLAGDGAAEINYRGMQPANIDGLAFAAVKMTGNVA